MPGMQGTVTHAGLWGPRPQQDRWPGANMFALSYFFKWATYSPRRTTDGKKSTNQMHLIPSLSLLK